MVADSQIFLLSNDGTHLDTVSNNLKLRFNVLAIYGTNLYAGTLDSGVWRRPLSELITSVRTNANPLPAGFSLSQNYPNPFNPSTRITYQLPVSSRVTLKVYDALGRLVEQLVDERESVGVHSVMFDASQLASGVYFYELEAGQYHDTKKLLLLK